MIGEIGGSGFLRLFMRKEDLLPVSGVVSLASGVQAKNNVTKRDTASVSLQDRQISGPQQQLIDDIIECK